MQDEQDEINDILSLDDNEHGSKLQYKENMLITMGKKYWMDKILEYYK